MRCNTCENFDHGKSKNCRTMLVDKDGLYIHDCDLFMPVPFKIGDVVDIIVYDPSRHEGDHRGKGKIESFTRDGLVYVTNCDASSRNWHASIFGQSYERTDIKPMATSKQSSPDSESCPDEPCVDCTNEKTGQCNSCFPVNGHKSKFDRKESNNHVTNWNARCSRWLERYLDSKKSNYSLQFYCTSCSDGVAIDLDRLVDAEGTLTCPTCHGTNFFRVKKIARERR